MTYDDLIQAGRNSLGHDEFWCVRHPDGPLEMTASKDLDHPIRVTCMALDEDWDILTEQGFRLGKIVLPEQNRAKAVSTEHMTEAVGRLG